MGVLHVDAGIVMLIVLAKGSGYLSSNSGRGCLLLIKCKPRQFYESMYCCPSPKYGLMIEQAILLNLCVENYH